MSMTVDEAAGQAIAQYRKTRGWTQGQLANVVKAKGLALAQQTIAKIELGTRPLKLSEAVVFADVLGVKVDNLLDFSTDGVSRLIIDYWAEELRDAQAAADEAIGRLENARVQAAVIVTRGENTPYKGELAMLRNLVESMLDFQERADSVTHFALASVEDKYERVMAWEMLGGSGDPAA